MNRNNIDISYNNIFDKNIFYTKSLFRFCIKKIGNKDGANWCAFGLGMTLNCLIKLYLCIVYERKIPTISYSHLLAYLVSTK